MEVNGVYRQFNVDHVKHFNPTIAPRLGHVYVCNMHR